MTLGEEVSLFEVVLFPLIAGAVGFALSGVPGLAGGVVFTISIGAMLKKLSANEKRIAKLEKQIEILENK